MADRLGGSPRRWSARAASSTGARAGRSGRGSRCRACRCCRSPPATGATAHRVAARWLTLEALTEPKQRRPLAVARAASSISPAGTPVFCSPQPGVQAATRGLELLPADRVALDEVDVHQPSRLDARGGVRTPAPHRCRERLQVQVGRLGSGSADRVDDDDPRAGSRGSQCSWACGADADGFAPQTMMQAVSRRCAGRIRPSRCRRCSRGRRGRPCCRRCPARPRSRPAG